MDQTSRSYIAFIVVFGVRGSESCRVVAAAMRLIKAAEHFWVFGVLDLQLGPQSFKHFFHKDEWTTALRLEHQDLMFTKLDHSIDPALSS